MRLRLDLERTYQGRVLESWYEEFTGDIEAAVHHTEELNKNMLINKGVLDIAGEIEIKQITVLSRY